jgi:hypothetical protein
MEDILEQNKTRCKFSRIWAMPSAWTFTIMPIRNLIAKYVGDGSGWFDPFAGENSTAEITNDLNPDRPTKFHMKAEDFINQLEGKFRGVLFDPPYSNLQMKECYEGVGLKYTFEDGESLFQHEKKLVAQKIEVGGLAICCGWNSGGMGKGLGFEMIEILLVPHGGAHHDTIVTVERKFQHSLF